jgi:curli biogenesis system outer membrane secretion channel CsgG
VRLDALGEAAADHMALLLNRSGRFTAVSGRRLREMLRRQNLDDLFKAGALVRPAKIDGVDYVLVGGVTDLHVGKAVENNTSPVGKVKRLFQRASQDRKVVITASCGVGIQLVDPRTGDVMLGNNSEFKRTAYAADLGLDVLKVGADARGEPVVSDSDREQVIRLALDDALRKSLPKIDRFLANQQRRDASPSATSVASGWPVATTQPSTPDTTTSTLRHAAERAPSDLRPCPTCGNATASAATFCNHCGARVK